MLEGWHRRSGPPSTSTCTTSAGRRVNDLRRAALTDPLTGLGNRRALETRIPVGDYALISLDLDHFKDVNDTFGHSAGDIVLSRVADVLTASVRGEDAVYRMGGEEFLIVLPDADAERATHVSERDPARASRASTWWGSHLTVGMTISLGVRGRLRGGDVADFNAALERADAALYESKHAGRDRVTVSAASLPR